MGYALLFTDRQNILGYARELTRIGARFDVGYNDRIVGYRLAAPMQPATFKEVLSYLRPEPRPSNVGYPLDQAASETLKRIMAASLEAARLPSWMDFMTMAPNNSSTLYSYLRKSRIGFKRFTDCVGQIYVEFDSEQVGGVDSAFFIRAAIGDKVGDAADEFADDVASDRNKQGASVMKALEVMYGRVVDLRRERYAPPLVPVRGMGTNTIDQATVDRYTRQSTLGTLFGIR